jgi:hypothetical protein
MGHLWCCALATALALASFSGQFRPDSVVPSGAGASGHELGSSRIMPLIQSSGINDVPGKCETLLVV